MANVAGLKHKMILPGAGRVEYHALLDIHVDPADQNDKRNEGPEIHLHVVMHRHADQLRDGLHRQPRPTTRQFGGFAHRPGGVDAAVLKARDGHPQIPRDGQYAGGLADRVDGEQDDGIGAGRTTLVADVAAAQAKEGDVDATASIPLGQVHLRRGDFGWNRRDRCSGFFDTVQFDRYFKIDMAICWRHTRQGSQLPAGGHMAHKEKRASRQADDETPVQHASPHAIL